MVSNETLSRIKKSGVAITKIHNRNSYVDTINKVVFCFTPRAACTLAFTQFLHLVGLLSDAQNFSPWIHDFRIQVLHQHVAYIDPDTLKRLGFLFIKFIMNPYRRVVSCFNIHPQEPHRGCLTFKNYLDKRIHSPEYFNPTDNAHHVQQYERGEHRYITKYIAVNLNETFEFVKKDKTVYLVNLSQFKSDHHTKKIDPSDPNDFFSDIPLSELVKAMPANYKAFYSDDTIRKAVEILYKDDIRNYPFKFEDQW